MIALDVTHREHETLALQQRGWSGVINHNTMNINEPLGIVYLRLVGSAGAVAL